MTAPNTNSVAQGVNSSAATAKQERLLAELRALPSVIVALCAQFLFYAIAGA